METLHASLCDNFYVTARLATAVNLPSSSGDVQHIFERARKMYPDLRRLQNSTKGEYYIEEDRDLRTYRWALLERKMISAGQRNPESLKAAFGLPCLLLDTLQNAYELAPIGVAYLEITFTFDLDFRGNHDEIVAEALYAGTPWVCLNSMPSARPLAFNTGVVSALDDNCLVQAQISVCTQSTIHQVRTGNYEECPISVALSIRRQWADCPQGPIEYVLQELVEQVDKICKARIIPNFVQPLANIIAARSILELTMRMRRYCQRRPNPNLYGAGSFFIF
jgi:hypothetical protein